MIRKIVTRFRYGLALLVVTGAGSACRDASAARLVPGGDPARGKQQITAYGCGACHTIPGVNQANGLVGPPLNGFSRRTYIAGQIHNNAENLIRWIMHPQEVERGTAMPDLGVSAAEARDIAAYLYTLR